MQGCIEVNTLQIGNIEIQKLIDGVFDFEAMPLDQTPQQ